MCTPENGCSALRRAANCWDNDSRIESGQLEPSKAGLSEDEDDDADDADKGGDGKAGSGLLAAESALSGNWLAAAKIDAF